MIGFIVAIEKESKIFLEKATITEESSIAGKRIVLGKYLDKDFVIAIAGIGKVNAALAT